MLESLAHTILRHRKLVVAVWVVLTAIGGFAAPKAANRLLTTFSIPSSQSYQHNQRIVQTFGNGDQNPMVLVFHDPAGDVTQAPGIQGALDAALKQNPGARISSYFNTGADSACVRVQGRAHHVRGHLPGGCQRLRLGRHDRGHPAGDRRERPVRGAGIGQRPGRARAGCRQRRQRWPQHPGRGRDRRARRADHPAVRVRHAAGGGDAADRRDGVDPEHLHPDPAAHLRHRRVGDRGVPGGAGRSRRRHRLLAPVHLPLPRGAGRGPVHPSTRWSRR